MTSAEVNTHFDNFMMIAYIEGVNFVGKKVKGNSTNALSLKARVKHGMRISQGLTMSQTSKLTNKTTTEVVYDESKILTLSSLEHIRLRPGMYIGRLGNGSHPSDGIYVLLKEIVDNSIDEFIMGFGKRIDILIENGIVNIRDFGRGIP